MRQLQFSLVLLSTLGFASRAYPWDKPGHSVTVDIAYTELAADHPDVLAKVVAILKKDADYAALLNWKSEVDASKLPESEMLFQLAARWPDDIKSDHSGRDKSPHNTHGFHYIDLPTGPNAAGHVPKEPNLFTAMAEFQREWRGAPDERRAQLLCWFIHLIGDSHQPLHAASYFNNAFPKGDGGGNSWKIRSIMQSSELHAFWDNVAIKAASNKTASSIAPEVHAKALELVASYPRTSFPQISVNKVLSAWTNNETFPLAVHVAYKDGGLPVPQPGHPAVLSPEYVKTAKGTAEAQMALAGYRIADFLVQLFETGRLGQAG